MVLSNAERQRRYRHNKAEAENGSEFAERLDIMVSLDARNALRRLARHYDLTQKATLEKVLADQQATILEQAPDHGRHYLRDL